jgi:hypothetical protein
MSIEGKSEYTPKSDRFWRELLDASAELDRVVAEYIQPIAKVGADDQDIARATTVLVARGVAATVDALQSIRQELTLTNNLLSQLRG